jgi:hypothetical protein
MNHQQPAQGGPPRFRFIDDEGLENSLPAVPHLAAAIYARKVRADTLLFDTAFGRWSAAAQHDVFVALQSVPVEMQHYITPAHLAMQAMRDNGY